MGYVLQEGLSGFTRAKLSTTISIFTISISLILLGTFAAIFNNLHEIAEELKQGVQIEVFLTDDISQSQRSQMNQRIAGRSGVENVLYISKDDAAAAFEAEFGEDIFSVLDFNPLPASFRITLQPEYIHTDSIAQLAAFIEGPEGTESVQYRQRLLELLTERIQTFLTVSVGIGALLAVSAIFLVSNTIRLTIYAKRKIIQTMKLVGATRSFIRKPFLLEGFIQGLCGGVIAAGMLYGGIYLVQTHFLHHLLVLGEYTLHFYAGVLAAGSLLGLLGSAVSIRRFLR
jgi:cell division transport system permease protein